MLGRIAQSSLCPWDLNFLSVLYHYAAGLRSKLLLCDTDPLQEAQLGVDWEGGLSSKASPSNAVGEGGSPLVPSLLSAAGRSGQEHPCWHSGNPLCLPSACARSPVRAPACEIQFSITKRPHQFAHQKAGHSVVYV